MIEMFLFLALILLSVIDIRKREFPAILTTSVLFLVLMVKLDNLEFGILAFVLAWFLMEFEFFSGGADLKILATIGLMISNLGTFMLFTILVLSFGTVYKLLMVYVIKQKEETAFVPVLFLVYITLLIIGVI